jgi:hypothetical protein
MVNARYPTKQQARITIGTKALLAVAQGAAAWQSFSPRASADSELDTPTRPA